MNKPTISRTSAGLYHFTGWVAERLVQYSILKQGNEWTVTKTYGQGAEFYSGFATKREAINAIAAA
jgi:hypothetical protein